MLILDPILLKMLLDYLELLIPDKIYQKLEFKESLVSRTAVNKILHNVSALELLKHWAHVFNIPPKELQSPILEQILARQIWKWGFFRFPPEPGVLPEVTTMGSFATPYRDHV